MTLAKRRNPFADPHAPILDKQLHRRQVIKAALERFIEDFENHPRERAAARHLLGEITLIERKRPNTTVVGVLSMTVSRMSVWCYEPDLAPLGHTVQIFITPNAEFKRLGSPAAHG